jgi:hypothetical protein
MRAGYREREIKQARVQTVASAYMPQSMTPIDERLEGARYYRQQVMVA